jgi:hypothetical protein
MVLSESIAGMGNTPIPEGHVPSSSMGPKPTLTEKPKKKRWLSALPPTGGILLALLVVPIAIEQYPEIFKESPWILPLSVVAVAICWASPLLVHERTKRIWHWSHKKIGMFFTVLAVALIFVCGILALRSIYLVHVKHLEARLKSNTDTRRGTDPAHSPLPLSPANIPIGKLEKKPPSVPSGPSFAVRIGVVWAGGISGDNSPILIRHDGPTSFLVPVNLAMQVSITNLQMFESRLDAYAFWAKTKSGRWAKLTRVDSQSLKVYLATDINKAFPLGNTSLEDVLNGKPIPPHQSVAGWLYFAYPSANAKYVERQYKVSLRDFTGAVFAPHILIADKTSFGQTGIQLGIPENLSGLEIRPLP